MQLQTISDVPQALIEGLAMGLATHEQLQARFDIDDATWDQLTDWKPLRQAVAAKRAEFEANGLTYKLKTALQAQDMNDRLYVIGMKSDTPTSAIIEISKHLNRIAGLDQPAVAKDIGTGFVVNINLDRPVVQEKVRVIEGEVKRRQSSDLAKGAAISVEFDTQAESEEC